MGGAPYDASRAAGDATYAGTKNPSKHINTLLRRPCPSPGPTPGTYVPPRAPLSVQHRVPPPGTYVSPRAPLSVQHAAPPQAPTSLHARPSRSSTMLHPQAFASLRAHLSQSSTVPHPQAPSPSRRAPFSKAPYLTPDTYVSPRAPFSVQHHALLGNYISPRPPLSVQHHAPLQAPTSLHVGPSQSSTVPHPEASSSLCAPLSIQHRAPPQALMCLRARPSQSNTVPHPQALTSLRARSSQSSAVPGWTELWPSSLFCVPPLQRLVSPSRSWGWKLLWQRRELGLRLPYWGKASSQTPIIMPS